MHFKHKYLNLVISSLPSREAGLFIEKLHSGTARTLDEEPEYVFQFSW